MSIKVMSEVWSSSEATQGHLLILLAIADFADDDGVAWPSVATLAKKARLKERRTQEILRELQDMGELVIVKGAGPNGTNQYAVRRGGAIIAGGAAEGTEGVRPSAPNPSYNRQHVPSGTEPENFNLSSAIPNDSKKKPGDLAQVVGYCREIGLPAQDGEYYWNKWLGNGFKNAGRAILDWRAVIRSAKAGGFTPSARRGNYGTKTDIGAAAHRQDHRRGHGQAGGEGEGERLPNL